MRSRLAYLGLFAFAATLLGVAGCASEPASKDALPASDAPALDGAYQATTGPIAWLGFRGDGYVAWSSDASCSDPSKAPASCADEGTFVVDAAGKLLTLTSNTGRISVYDLDVLTSSSSAGETTPQNLVSTEKIADDSPVAPIVKSFWMGDPANHAQGFFKKFLVTCRIISIIVTGVPDATVVPQPPAITGQQCKRG